MRRRQGESCESQRVNKKKANQLQGEEIKKRASDKDKHTTKIQTRRRWGDDKENRARASGQTNLCPASFWPEEQIKRKEELYICQYNIVIHYENLICQIKRKEKHIFVILIHYVKLVSCIKRRKNYIIIISLHLSLSVGEYHFNSDVRKGAQPTQAGWLLKIIIQRRLNY